MAKPSDTVSTDCFICRPDSCPLHSSSDFKALGHLGFPFCEKHGEEEIEKAVLKTMEQRLPGHELEAVRMDARIDDVSVAAPEAASEKKRKKRKNKKAKKPATTIDSQSPAPEESSQKGISKVEDPNSPVDTLTQDLPPPDILNSPEEHDVHQTEKVIDLAYACVQLDIAASAVSNAYDKLKGIDQAELPTQSLRDRVTKISRAAKDVGNLTHKKKDDDDAGSPQ